MMNPTFVGYIGSTKDALLIIQSTLNNQLSPVGRRPHDRERSNLIKSGNVFVFIEERSGIKRWTDGVAWSPSRILGRFLVYRELNKNSKEEDPDKQQQKQHTKRRNSGGSVSVSKPSTDSRNLVGSLITSYAFKEGGLIKKTLSLTVKKPDSNASYETIHLVSYYSAKDVLSGNLVRPIDSPLIKNVPLSPELWNAIRENSLGGKIPIEDESYYMMNVSNPNAAALGFKDQAMPSAGTVTTALTAGTTSAVREKASSFSGPLHHNRLSFSSQGSGGMRQSSDSSTTSAGYPYYPNTTSTMHPNFGHSASISSVSSNPEELHNLKYLNQYLPSSNSSSISSSSSYPRTSQTTMNTSPPLHASSAMKLDKVPTVQLGTPANTSTATLTNKKAPASPTLSPKTAKEESYSVNPSNVELNMVPRFQQSDQMAMMANQSEAMNQQLSYQTVPQQHHSSSSVSSMNPQYQQVSTPAPYPSQNNSASMYPHFNSSSQGQYPPYNLQHSPQTDHITQSFQMPMMYIPSQSSQIPQQHQQRTSLGPYYDQYTLVPSASIPQQQQQQLQIQHQHSGSHHHHHHHHHRPHPPHHIVTPTNDATTTGYHGSHGNTPGFMYHSNQGFSQ